MPDIETKDESIELDEFEDHDKTIQRLKEAQEADSDLRENAREAHHFTDKRNGMWEDNIFASTGSGRPRYTFDFTNPIIDQIAGEMEQADFDISVSPAGGDATKDIAQTFDGLIRNIENISNAKHVFNHSGRMMVTSGLDGWEIVQEFVDSDSFDQDLIIKKVGNFLDRVWFDPSAEEQDKSDSKFGFKLTGFTTDEYEKKWPEGSAKGVRIDHKTNVYFNNVNLIMVGQFYYIKLIERELVLMSDGKVHEANDDFEKVKDELAQGGVTEVRRRSRNKGVVFVRQFDAEDWLNDAEKTVFEFIPLIPTYGNYKISENKSIYWGVVEKAMDFQRVFNYAKSREIEEGSLAPRAKYWMTPAQYKDNKDELATLNVNADPVQLYNHDPTEPGPPQQQGGAQINPGLIAVSQSMQDGLQRSAGFVAPSMGEQVNNQSGVAIKKLQDKGDTGSIKYFSAQEVAICHTARIILKAAPKVYDAEGRVVRILKEDDSFDMVTLNENIFDEESQQVVKLNDLSVGAYDVVCSAGPAFKNRQEETVSALVEIAQVDPSVIQIGGDVLLKNVTAPGMDLIAERKRAQLFQQGLIPEDQMTDEEKEQLQALQNQPQQPDAAMVLAQAEQTKADADVLEAQNDTRRLDIEGAKVGQKDDELKLKAEDADMKILIEVNRAQTESLNKQADTLNKLIEAVNTGILTPGLAKVLDQQVREIDEEQVMQQ